MFGAIPPSQYFLGLVPWYSLLMVLAITLAIWLCSKEEKRLGLPKDTVIDLALWLIPAGIAGARLYYVAFTWEQFARDPVRIFYIWEGGIAIYGAILGGLAACFIFSRIRRLSFARLVDLVISSLALAQAIGRWGNYFNMEAYGEAITNPALQFFPFGVLIPEGGGYTWHLATFFYESLWDLATFSILWLIRKKTRRSGDLALWYTLLYGPGRTFIEGLRMDSLRAGSGGIRISQWLSVAACLAACLILCLRASGSPPRGRGMRWAWLALIPCLLTPVAMGLNTAHGLQWIHAWPTIVSLGMAGAMLCLPGQTELRKARLAPLLAVQAAQLLLFPAAPALSPLLSRTLLSLFSALTYPAAGFLYYPATPIQKEESRCGT